MKTKFLLSSRTLQKAGLAAVLGIALGGALIASATTLSDQPVFSTSEVPGNLALALSVEWPTASRTAHVGAYTSASTYLGYFDPNKCYLYQTNTTANSTNTGDISHFYPAGPATSRTCTGTSNNNKWSGNFLNWAATATIDPFRWAMTGGRRVVDTTTETILEKGWHSGQGLFADRDLTVSEIAGATPYDTATRLGIRVNGMGFKMRLSINDPAARTFTANYYNNKNFTNPAVLTVSNDTADHNWGNASPGTGVNVDNFSVRFTGTFTAPETGNYIFRTNSDDGVRLWVDTSGSGSFGDGNRIINNFSDHGPTDDDSGSISLTAGQSFSVRVDYFESSGGATMRLLWQKPSTPGTFTPFSSGDATVDYTMRVKVCDPSTAAGGVEANCKAYGSNYKPEGLIQKYSQRIRFSAFGYLNDASDQRDGGVLRAAQKFVGPTAPRPGQTAIANTQKEWSDTTGIFEPNPNGADATATTTEFGVQITNSGVMNYLNQFGQLIPGNYKNYDPVSEMYYAVLRYYKNLGNVPAWSSMTGASAATKTTWIDGFPVITSWDDPIQYSCQRNFILGIGDIYTHVDKNVAGNTTYRTREPAMPAEIAADNTVNAITATNKVGSLQGLGNALGATNSYSGRDNSAYIAGLAYDANTKDIRPDVANQAKTIGKQTVQTYWVDVLEQPFQANNQFYLAAKFGGLKVPANFDPYTFAATIPLDWWSTNGETLTDTRTNTTQQRPDNYFAAGRPDTLVAGLTQALESIVSAIKAYTTSFSLSAVQVSSAGAASYASQYDANGWTSIVTASEITFDSAGNPTTTLKWASTDKLAAQFTGTGWDTNRRIATWNGTAGVAFRTANLTTAQATALNTSYVTGDDSANYLNYLRGDRSNERSLAAPSRPYRTRATLLGDIVNAKVTPVAPPGERFSEAVNPGYKTFKTTWASRPTMVYAAANDGMLHAFNGALTGTEAGAEQFAYVPSAVFQGPSSPAAPQDDGLAQLGNPNYLHHYYVDATPKVFDVDFSRAGGNFVTDGTSRWRSILVGGLGKGGKSYYAIDVTNPAGMTSEATVASKVLWEFTDPTMGYSFGAPTIVKTKRYGWVVVLTSGYNNSDGLGYLYFVNPETGALLQKVSTGVASNGLTHASAYVQDFTDYTADAIYVGDLDGQLWRFDVTAPRGTTTAYPTPTKLALLTDGTTAGRPQAITTQPLIEIHPQTRKRYVMFGTGQLLDPSDISSTTAQTFYSIIDGNATSFAPADATMPITRANLTALTNLTTGVTLPNTSKGWYLDLGADTSSSVTWRMTLNPLAFNGVVSFAPLLTIGDACSPSGISRFYAIDFGTGKSALTPDGQAFVESNSAITDLAVVGVDGKTRWLTGNVLGEVKKQGVKDPGGLGLRLLNWREVPTVD